MSQHDRELTGPELRDAIRAGVHRAAATALAAAERAVADAQRAEAAALRKNETMGYPGDMAMSEPLGKATGTNVPHRAAGDADVWNPEADGKVRGSILERLRQRQGAPAKKSPSAIRGVPADQIPAPKPMAKGGPPPIPHDARSTGPKAGAAIPPRIPGLARPASRGAPARLPGMPGPIGEHKPDLVPVTPPKRPAAAPTMASVRVPTQKAEGAARPKLPGLTPPKVPAAAPTSPDKANREIKGFKSIVSSPTAMPHNGKLAGKMPFVAKAEGTCPSCGKPLAKCMGHR